VLLNIGQQLKYMAKSILRYLFPPAAEMPQATKSLAICKQPAGGTRTALGTVLVFVVFCWLASPKTNMRCDHSQLWPAISRSRWCIS